MPLTKLPSDDHRQTIDCVCYPASYKIFFVKLKDKIENFQMTTKNYGKYQMYTLTIKCTKVKCSGLIIIYTLKIEIWVLIRKKKDKMRTLIEELKGGRRDISVIKKTG